jgi:hypothetical protein
MAKYKNKKITVDGIAFDSKKEAKRYTELKALEQAGAIIDLRLQVKYTLIPAQYIYDCTKSGKQKRKLLEREISYIADFVYMDCNGITHVEDVKSPYLRKEPRFVMKRKMMLYFHGLRIEEV